jgi:hypothetical protein
MSYHRIEVVLPIPHATFKAFFLSNMQLYHKFLV